jgi:hypothetical protein
MKDAFNLSSGASKPVMQCVRKVAVHLPKLLEVKSTSVYVGLNPYRTVALVHSDFTKALYII